MHRRTSSVSVLAAAVVVALLAGTITSALPVSARSAAGLSVIHPGYLTVGSDTTYPPMEFADPKNPGKFEGADVDLADALAREMGLKGAQIAKGTFDSLIPSLNAKRYDVIMSSMNDTPDRRKAVAFVDYLAATEAILVRSSSKVHANSYAGVCGLKVAVERGTTEEAGMNAANKTCKSKIGILSFSGDTDAYQAFISGHADAYTGDRPVVDQYVKSGHGQFRAAGKPINSHQNYGIAVRKSDTALKSALAKAVASIRKNGQYMKILKKWGVADAALK